MKLTAIFAAISLSALVAAAPVPTESRRGFIPKPMDLIEMMYPHSGIPRLAGKLEKELHLCLYPSGLTEWKIELTHIFTELPTMVWTEKRTRTAKQGRGWCE
jgi:hypothetical protein